MATAAGKAAFWDMAGTVDAPKMIALEGEFAMTKRRCAGTKNPGPRAEGWQLFRVVLLVNNAGIDDELLGGVMGSQIRAMT